jgi:hypothetical protein
MYLFSCKQIGGAKLYWNKCIQRCESTQHNPNQKNLSIFKENQQNFGKKTLKMYLYSLKSTSVFIYFYSKIVI